MSYANIVFMQGDDASEPLAILHNRERDPETGMDIDESIVWHCPTAESVAATFLYLMQWDYGEGHEVNETSQAGTSDWQETLEQDGVKYVMTYNVGLSYIGLERVID